MIINVKDAIKLIGVSIVSFCAVFVSTFMLNYYLDVLPLGGEITDTAMLALYEAQLATAKFSSGISGGVLSLIALIMLFFYIKIYIDAHARQFGIIKAMGYADHKIAFGFWVFGLSIFLGCACGFAMGWAIMRPVYDSLTIEGMGTIAIHFHWELLLGLVFAPGIVFSLFACLYAYRSLGRPVMQMMKDKNDFASIKGKDDLRCKEQSFLKAMSFSVLKRKKSLAFFIAFSSFCFSAMVQMGLSMEDLSSAIMGYMILVIGLVLAAVTMIMSVTTLIRSNQKNISVMKAFGYSLRDCIICLFAIYVPFALLGFALGTVYQYGLLQLMINVVFSKVDTIPQYSFDVSVFFITLAAFIVCYGIVILFYIRRISKISVKVIMAEN